MLSLRLQATLLVVLSAGCEATELQFIVHDSQPQATGVGCALTSSCATCPGGDCGAQENFGGNEGSAGPSCPPDNCLLNPCDFAHCAADSNARCVPNYCKCADEWYNGNNKPVDCAAVAAGKLGEDLPDICGLPMEIGPCDEHLLRYYYNDRTERCEEFSYGGCAGNKNNFKALGDCQTACGVSASVEQRETPTENHGPQSHIARVTGFPHFPVDCSVKDAPCGGTLSSCCDGLSCCHPAPGVPGRFCRTGTCPRGFRR